LRIDKELLSGEDMETKQPTVSWEELQKLIVAGESDKILAYLHQLDVPDTALAISRLSTADQKDLLKLLNPVDAAVVLEEIHESQAADMITELPPDEAASIIVELGSDRRADVLGEMKDINAEAILEQLTGEEAEDIRQKLEYSTDSAGGLMISEFLAFRADRTLREVLEDLHANQDRYRKYNVQYIYVVDQKRKLVGVLRIHDLLFANKSKFLHQVMIADPRSIRDRANLDELLEFFELNRLFGAPVVDEEHRLIGVVLPGAVQEANRKRADKQFLRLSGIVGGEEFRSMPLWIRSGRRLSWLSLNIVLNIIAASVIALYQDTLAAVIALAVFLPMVSDMSGCSGNQAVAVSMRELALGLVRPTEYLRVVFKEAGLGIVNGLVLGCLLGTVAFLWKGNIFLGIVVGGALAANTLLSVTFGGLLPLVFKRLKMDTALVSSPVLSARGPVRALWWGRQAAPSWARQLV
jgi:magnesium transporter